MLEEICFKLILQERWWDFHRSVHGLVGLFWNNGVLVRQLGHARPLHEREVPAITGLEPLQKITHPAAGLMQVAMSRLPGKGDPCTPSSLPLTCFGKFWNGHTCGMQCLTWFTSKTIYSSNSPRNVVPEGTERSLSNQSVITGPSGILLSRQLPQTRTVPSAGHFGWQTIFCPTLFFSFFRLLNFGFLFPLKRWCFLRLMTWRSTWSSRWR